MRARAPSSRPPGRRRSSSRARPAPGLRPAVGGTTRRAGAAPKLASATTRGNRPLWLLLLYFLWQSVLIGTVASLYWRRAELQSLASATTSTWLKTWPTTRVPRRRRPTVTSPRALGLAPRSRRPTARRAAVSVGPHPSNGRRARSTTGVACALHRRHVPLVWMASAGPADRRPSGRPLRLVLAQRRDDGDRVGRDGHPRHQRRQGKLRPQPRPVPCAAPQWRSLRFLS